MAPPSITRSLRMVGAGGIGVMRQVIRCWKGKRGTPESEGRECGLILSQLPSWVYRKTGRGQLLDLSDLVPLDLTLKDVQLRLARRTFRALRPLYIFCSIGT